jgi:hypothetical protein
MRQVPHVETAVKCCDGPFGHIFEHREVKHIGVEVDHIEAACAAAYFCQHLEVGGEIGLQWCRVEPDSPIAYRYQFGTRLGLGACKERYLMSQIHQGIGEVGYNTLGSSI